MENLKRMIKKVMIFLLIFALCVPAMELNNAQAAKLSSRKVDKLYSNALNKWISHPKRMKITDDLRARSGWNYNDTGKGRYTQDLLFRYVNVDEKRSKCRWDSGISCLFATGADAYFNNIQK